MKVDSSYGNIIGTQNRAASIFLFKRTAHKHNIGMLYIIIIKFTIMLDIFKFINNIYFRA